MATTYLTPGIYIEEVSTGARPIEAVGTSVAGFVGEAPQADAERDRVVAVNNWSEFRKRFAPEGGEPPRSTPLAQAVYGYFLNGGGRCYIVNVGQGGSIVGGGPGRKGLDLLEEVDEVATVVAPGYSDPASHGAMLDHCEKLRDRVAILDAPANVTDIDRLKEVGVVPTGTTPASGLRPRQSDGGYGAFYFPHITIRDPLTGETVAVPPSGHMAGIYARTDATRGVHKAPANEAIRGALNVAYRVTHDEQAILNPVGVNCIRFFPQEGIRIWGARTLAASSSEWRYVNVRRLFNMIEKSIARSTRWIVFEPNDIGLWKSIRRDISAFLTILWRQGALMGATPEEAFFVKCDAETNPPEEIDLGRVSAMIGIAPVKPAEFVIFRIGQSAAGTEVQTPA